MRYINEKGQAFSVFRLLISAIVAFAILSILLTILPNPRFGRDPGRIAKEMIGDRMMNPGSRSDSDVVTFEKGSNIAPTAIVQGTGITKDQVCVSKGEYFENTDFKFYGQALYYEGSSPVDVKMSVMCDNPNDLAAAISDFREDWFERSGLINDEGEDAIIRCGESCTREGTGRTCCAVWLRFK